MRIFQCFVLLAILSLIGCTAGAVDQASSATPGQPVEADEAGLISVIVEQAVAIETQAFIIEALQGEIVALQEGAGGNVHIVEDGQNLWMIADNILGDPYKWVTLYSINCFLMDDPNMIYPHQVLMLP